MGMDPSTTEPREPETARELDDAKMETIMGRLLQVGVLLAAGVVLGGGASYLQDHAGERSNYRVFTATPIQLRHPAALLHALGRGDSAGIIELGILLLVATPICRVIFAVIAFAVERDKLYVAVSLTVLGVLLYGMLRVT
jgi:uncharacterized membrane protein